MEERRKPADRRSESNEEAGGPEPDALESFRQAQGEKCAAHHRTSTAEIMALIRKHKKEG